MWSDVQQIDSICISHLVCHTDKLIRGNVCHSFPCAQSCQ